MPNLEPSYLRYVHDQLASSVISPENAAALPNGFIGLYEKEFPQKISVNERQDLLRYLTTWALFKGPVSAKLASNILKVSEEEVKDFIDRYSSWFNSPESGKYQLYHERLRVFILQKLNDKEIQALNEQIISYLDKAVKETDGSEDEKYALQFLHNHMALESMLGIDYERLHNYVNRESLWERQIKVSKSYEWSQNAVQQGIKEGARRDHEMNTIRSTVNSVKLMTQEQNSAEAIIELLNEGDYHSALKRAESWEGDRQFKLYLLFIHELTIGTSKEADFRKVACKSVLEAIDQTPEDHSVLDWTKFYPELAIYKYYEQLLKMNLDGMVIWRRGAYCLKSVIKNADIVIDIDRLYKLGSYISDEEDFMNYETSPKSEAYRAISQHLIKKGDIKRAQNIASMITYSKSQSMAYQDISKSLFEQGDSIGAKESLNKAVEIASLITSDFYRSKMYAKCAILWMKFGLESKANDILLRIDVLKVRVLICLDLYKLSKYLSVNNDKRYYLINAVENSRKIDSYFERFKAFLELSDLLFKEGDLEGSNSWLRECFDICGDMEEEGYLKSRAYSGLSISLADRRDKEESFRVASEIMHSRIKFKTLMSIAAILFNYGDEGGGHFVMDESFRMALQIQNRLEKSEACFTISQAFLKHGNIKRSYQIAKEILDTEQRSQLYSELALFLFKNGSNAEGLGLVTEIPTIEIKLDAYLKISKMLTEADSQALFVSTLLQSLDSGRRELNDSISSTFLTDLTLKIMHKGNLAISSLIASSLDYWEKSELYPKLYEWQLSNGLEESTVDFASELNDYFRSRMKLVESVFFLKKKDKDKSYSLADEIADFGVKSDLLFRLSEVLIAQGDLEEALRLTAEIHDVKKQSDSYRAISVELSKKHGLNDTIKVANMIPELQSRSLAFAELSAKFLEKGEINNSTFCKREAFRIADEILSTSASNDTSISNSLKQLFDDNKIIFDETEKRNNSNLISGFEVYIELSKIMGEMGDMKRSKKARYKSLSLAEKLPNSNTSIEDFANQLIEDYNYTPRDKAYMQLSKLAMEQGNYIESLSFVTKISDGQCFRSSLEDLGQSINYSLLLDSVDRIANPIEKNLMIMGFSKSTMMSEGKDEIIMRFLHKYYSSTNVLDNILFYKAKMTCFFEQERNEEKLDMLSEVLDIEDWRRISASL